MSVLARITALVASLVLVLVGAVALVGCDEEQPADGGDIAMDMAEDAVLYDFEDLGSVAVPEGTFETIQVPAEDYPDTTVAACSSDSVVVVMGCLDPSVTEEVDVAEGLESLVALSALQKLLPEGTEWNIDEYGVYASFEEGESQCVVYVLQNEDASHTGFVKYASRSGALDTRAAVKLGRQCTLL